MTGLAHVAVGLAIAATAWSPPTAGIPEIGCTPTTEMSQYLDRLSAVGTVVCDEPADQWLRVRIQAAEVADGDFHGVGSVVSGWCRDAELCVKFVILDCVPNTGRWFRARVVSRVEGVEVQKLHSDPIEAYRWSLGCGGVAS